ncbi:MAG TPA: DUF6691 family protein [Longimicrobiaceae bacterium]|nr:DUF6691 family protein [Longimicrobiaceae bacterium]
MASSAPASTTLRRGPGLAVYFAVGLLFGVVLIRAEVVSWFRIQEMFRFQGFHMFGLFATALPVAILSVQAIKRSGARTLGGEPVTIPPKAFGRGIRYGAGGVVFGLGWALTGACPGPLFALFGSGVGVIGVAILSALAGTWTYGWLRPKLPH